MLRTLSLEEEMRSRRKVFKRLRPGMLISMYLANHVGASVHSFFLTWSRLSPTSWSLLPLDRKSIRRIIDSKPVQNTVTKHLEDMRCLQIHEQD